MHRILSSLAGCSAVIGVECHRVWQTVSSSVDENGNVNYQTNSFTELCSGICYEEDGKWYDSVEEIELHPDGAFAQKAPHKFFAPNLNEEAPWN